MGKQLLTWSQELEHKWATLYFGQVRVETRGEHHLYQAQVYLHDLDPGAVKVEVYADSIPGSEPVRREMRLSGQVSGTNGGYIYAAAVSANRPQTDYTLRIIPFCPGANVPLESAHICWQR
jgi:starch phosphorylase